MLTDNDRAEIRNIANEVVGAHMRAAGDALAPVFDVLTEIHKFGDLLLEMQKSLALVIDGHTRIETAISEAADPDRDEPWRESL